MHEARRFLRYWLYAVVALAGILATANVAIDPYRLFHVDEIRGFNYWKPRAGQRGPMVKAVAAERMAPRTVMLGNSRVEVGFDPQSAAIPAAARPVFNAALPGTGPWVAYRYLQHIVAHHRPQRVILGVDFMDFLFPPGLAYDAESFRRRPHDFDRWLRVNADGSANEALLANRIEDYLQVAFSLDTLLDAGDTLAAQYRRYPAHQTSDGFNPMLDYVGLARSEGYRRLFLQRDAENAKSYGDRPQTIAPGGKLASPAFEALDAILALCAREGIALDLVVYPYHAHLMETIRAAGLWPELERWKRELTERAQGARAASPPTDVRLWDFATYNSFTTEAVPARGGRTATMRWYWEAGHFKAALGERVLARIFGEDAGDAAFGVRLTPADIDAHLADVREREAAYRAHFPADVAQIERLMAGVRAASAGSRRRGRRRGRGGETRGTPAPCGGKVARRRRDRRHLRAPAIGRAGLAAAHEDAPAARTDRARAPGRARAAGR